MIKIDWDFNVANLKLCLRFIYVIFIAALPGLTWDGDMESCLPVLPQCHSTFKQTPGSVKDAVVPVHHHDDTCLCMYVCKP